MCTAGTLLDAAAGSVATRGLLYSVLHQAPRSWLPLRASAGNPADKARRANAEVLRSMASSAAARDKCAVATVGGAETLAVHVLPALRALADGRFPAARTWLHSVLPSSWSYVHNGAVQLQQQQATGVNEGNAALEAALGSILSAADARRAAIHMDDSIED